MRAASSALIALLASTSEFFMCDLLTITQLSGAVTRLTTWDTSLTIGGNTFSAGPLTFVRDTMKVSIGVTADTMGVTLQCGSGAAAVLLGSVPWPQAVRTGALDGARVKLERLFMATPGDTSAGTVALFSGRVAEATPSRDMVALSVKSDLELLDTQFPRNLYQPGCMHTLFDAGCTLSKAAFANPLTTLIGASPTSVSATTSRPTQYFDLGTITFTSGALSGLSFSVKSFVLTGGTGTFTFAQPLPSAPAAGDTFTAYPGCDKTLTTCQTKFSNLAHFRGYPFIPAPETLL